MYLITVLKLKCVVFPPQHFYDIVLSLCLCFLEHENFEIVWS